MSAEESAIQPAAPAPSPAPAPAIVAPAPEPTKPTIPEDRREIIAKAMRNPIPRSERPRAPDGKFAPSPQFPTPETVAPIQRPAMPKSLKLELQPHWDVAPQPLLEAIQQRELQNEEGVKPLIAKAREADTILNEFKPYEMLLRNENATPATAIKSLLRTASILRMGTPAQKAHEVAATMQQFGIPLEHIQHVLGGSTNGNGAPPQPAFDPHVQMLTQQVQQLTMAQQQQQNNRALAAIKRFSGNPEHKHFDAVSERMSALLQAPQAMDGYDEGMSEDEKLKLAYDTAIYSTPDIRQQILAEQQAKDQAALAAQQQIAQAKAAAVQITGAPASGPPPKPDPANRREIIANAMRRAR